MAFTVVTNMVNVCEALMTKLQPSVRLLKYRWVTVTVNSINSGARPCSEGYLMKDVGADGTYRKANFDILKSTLFITLAV